MDSDAWRTRARGARDRRADLAGRPPRHTDTWGVRQVAREMNTSPSTIYRIFQVFESRDLVTKNEDGRYTPGLELFRICRVFPQRLSPVRIAKPHLEKLALACGETVLLAALRSQARPDDSHRHHRRAAPAARVVRLNQWNAIHSGPPAWRFSPSCPRRSAGPCTRRTLSGSPSGPWWPPTSLRRRPPGSAPGLRVLPRPAVTGRGRLRRAPVRRRGRRVRRRVHHDPRGPLRPRPGAKAGQPPRPGRRRISADLQGAGFLRDT